MIIHKHLFLHMFVHRFSPVVSISHASNDIFWLGQVGILGGYCDVLHLHVLQSTLV